MSKIYLIDGLPGIGKSTTVYKLAKHFEETGMKVKTLYEHEFYPTELLWSARVSKDKYEEILNKYPEYGYAIRAVSVNKDNFMYIRYRVLQASREFNEELKQHEIFLSRNKKDFTSILQSKWKELPDIIEENSVYIIECMIFQDYINECILLYDMTVEEVTKLTNSLLSSIDMFNPEIVYLKTNKVKTVLDNIINTRKPSDPLEKSWSDFALEIVETFSRFGKKQLQGYTGLLDYIKLRQETELAVLPNLSVKCHTYCVDEGYDNLSSDIFKDLR